jgi:hypothetical protein
MPKFVKRELRKAHVFTTFICCKKNLGVESMTLGNARQQQQEFYRRERFDRLDSMSFPWTVQLSKLVFHDTLL